MDAIKFTGWIEKIYDANDYDQKFVVNNFKDDAMRENMRNDKDLFPNTLVFTLSVKTGANSQLDGLHEGDKVQVKYYVAGRSGISKAGKYYAIVNLNVAKKDGVELLERGERKGGPTDDTGSDDIPF